MKVPVAEKFREHERLKNLAKQVIEQQMTTQQLKRFISRYGIKEENNNGSTE
jgi:hypothetical protein